MALRFQVIDSTPQLGPKVGPNLPNACMATAASSSPHPPSRPHQHQQPIGADFDMDSDKVNQGKGTWSDERGLGKMVFDPWDVDSFKGLADVLRENTEAVFAACDAAHGRWAKLLGVRALLHPRLRLQEFLGIYNITQEFITATEKIGGRLGYSIRGMLQSQAKAFVDFQHESKMAKIKAVLDQETWVEVDVPDEFQAIVTSLFCSEPLTAEHTDDGQDNTARVNSLPVIEPTENNKSDVLTSLGQSNSTNNKQRGKSSSQTLLFRGVGYHMVNCGLILLKMLSEYIDMSNYLPVLSSEVVHRVVEILKFFNTRTCQLVLGAGAMQVSGLKSITSKHLALASQVVSFTYAIIPGRGTSIVDSVVIGVFYPYHLTHQSLDLEALDTIIPYDRQLMIVDLKRNKIKGAVGVEFSVLKSTLRRLPKREAPRGRENDMV
ncbi:hypothetical protein TEA_003790 [Camellia sinensis var. sinensis]|uniref:Vacuolar protein sorting-associated protein 54 C-terminal domain-containing protein n=1 Tax=Camellia sinensis var. sinensis TaxID=542762 RepID=A0A4S4D807_CAMSN|nr:hypothetical protein TEA_003790 [Camellia sinensis var. sinensis]